MGRKTSPAGAAGTLESGPKSGPGGRRPFPVKIKAKEIKATKAARRKAARQSWPFFMRPETGAPDRQGLRPQGAHDRQEKGVGPSPAGAWAHPGPSLAGSTGPFPRYHSVGPACNSPP